MSAHLLKSVRPYNEEATDILIVDQRIAAMGEQAREQAAQRDDVIEHDFAGLVALPGFVDVHTHLRQPGKEEAETVFTGTRAAAAGGYTAVFAMANTNPVADNVEIVEQVYDLGTSASWVDVHPVGAVTKNLECKELSDIEGMAASRAQVRLFSDDGKCVHDSLLMRQALEKVKAFGGVVAQHAQDPRLTIDAQMNESDLSRELGLNGWPAVAEESIIARDILLANYVGSRIHVCHLSTAGSVEIVRWAKSQGFNVTAEVTPHHLLLTDELARTYSPIYKVNPPLRSAKDVQALREALADGTIDVVATDHAPHPMSDKTCHWNVGAFGMTGLETALSIIIETMVNTNKFNWRDVARVMSVTPAKIGGLEDQGQEIVVGSLANLAIIDVNERHEVVPTEQWTKGDNSPYAGMELPGKVVATFLKGRSTVLDGQPVALEEQK